MALFIKGDEPSTEDAGIEVPTDMSGLIKEAGGIAAKKFVGMHGHRCDATARGLNLSCELLFACEDFGPERKFLGRVEEQAIVGVAGHKGGIGQALPVEDGRGRPSRLAFEPAAAVKVSLQRASGSVARSDDEASCRKPAIDGRS